MTQTGLRRLIYYLLNLFLLSKFAGGTQPQLTVSPSYISKRLGSPLSSGCKISGIEDLDRISKVEWKHPLGWIVPYYRSTSNDTRDKRVVEMPNRSKGPKDIDLFIYTLKIEDEGTFLCSVTYDGNKTIEEPVKIEVMVPAKIRNQTLNQTLNIGKEGKVECIVIGRPTHLIDWTKDGVAIQSGNEYVVQDDGLYINNVTEHHEGEYQCRARQINTGIVESIKIQVKVRLPPEIVQPPNDTTVEMNGLVIFKCETPEESTPKYTWRNQNSEILNEREGYYVDEITGNLRIINVRQDQAGEYTCTAENEAGKNSATAKLIVKGEESTTGETTPVSPPQKPKFIGMDSSIVYFGPHSDYYDIEWKPSSVEVDYYDITYYEIKNTINGWKQKEERNQTRLINSTQTSYKLEGLKGNSFYRIRLRSINKSGFSAGNEFILKTAPGNKWGIKDPETEAFVKSLMKFSTNIFLRKPTDGSPPYNDDKKYQTANVVDGDHKTYFYSQNVTNPWVLIDLQGLYLIWEIRITIHTNLLNEEAKVYLANEIDFSESHKPNMTGLAVFASHSKDSKINLRSPWIFRQPKGMVARYVILSMEDLFSNFFLYEIEGTGYFLG